MREDTLWEGSSGGVSSKSLGETERFSDWKMSFHLDEWGSGNWLLTDNDTSSLGKSLINWSNNIIWGLDLNQEDWLLELWLSGELTSVDDSSACWENLTSTSMDGIGMKGNIVDVESASSHVLIAHNTLSGGPLEGSLNGIFDFVKELDSLGNINNEIWSVVVWSIAPNFECIGFIPFEFLDKSSSLFLGLGFWTELFFLDKIGKIITKWLTLKEESVMLVW